MAKYSQIQKLKNSNEVEKRRTSRKKSLSRTPKISKRVKVDELEEIQELNNELEMDELEFDIFHSYSLDDIKKLRVDEDDF